MAAQPRQFLPTLPAIARTENRSVFHSRVDRIGILQRWLQMPNAFELPRVRRAVVPLVRARVSFVFELVSHRRPRLPAIIRALNDLSEPTARLRCIQPVRINRRSLDVIDLPTGKMRPADLPLFALAIRGQNESPLVRPNQYPYPAHHFLPFDLRAHRRQYQSQLQKTIDIVKVR